MCDTEGTCIGAGLARAREEKDGAGELEMELQDLQLGTGFYFESGKSGREGRRR